MKTLFSSLFVVLFATTMVAQSGLTCNDPIPVDADYEGLIPAAGTYWFSANTYDLPLNVFFRPTSDNCTISPKVEVDFTCVPGKYADPKLDSVINTAMDLGFALPLSFTCGQAKIDGKYVYDLSIDNRYREMLAECGISYNVQAFVRVEFPEAGEVIINPDTAFAACMNNAHLVALDDTMNILPNDSDRVFAFPFPEWKRDSIRFVWVGEQPARVWLATQECDFTPKTTNVYVWNYYDVAQDQPCKFQPSDLEQAIKENDEGGIFYGKILSSAPGKLVVEKIPVTPPAGGAVLLEYGVPVQVQANDYNAIFAIPKSWKQASMFVVSSATKMQAEFSNVHTFQVQSGTYLRTYASNTINGETAVRLTELELTPMINSNIDNYTYVRFIANQPTTITPLLWEVSPCMNKAYAITVNQQFATGGKDIYHRFYFDDYSGYDLTIQWHTTGRPTIYLADTCEFALNRNNPHVIQTASLNRSTPYVIPAATLEQWADRVDADGYLYVRFSTTGNVTFLTEKPEPVDPDLPAVPTTECSLSSLPLAQGDQVVLNLDSAFTVYRIDYKAWLKSGATLAWNGAEPLHTFVAETCAFALAPYNRYVLAYIPVPAQGSIVLDANQLAAMEEYVSEDGFLYIRFLTKEEGVLEVK